MFQFSDSDSVDSDEGIRYKTDSIRNKKSSDKNPERSYRRRERDRSRSRSRSHHHTERKKLNKREKDYSPEDKSSRKSSRSKHRDSDRSDDKKHRKQKEKSKKEDTSINKQETVEEKPRKIECTSNNNQDRDLPSKENSNATKSTDIISTRKSPVPKPHTSTTKLETIDVEQSQNGNTFGPQLPPHLTRKPDTEDNLVGPALPSHFITVSSLDDDSDMDSSSTQENKETGNENHVIGPALPPHLLKKTDEDIIGPALPSHLQQESISLVEDEENEDEDVYGPVPVGAQYSQAHVELEERALQMKIDQLDSSGNKQPAREEWMLELPEAKAATFGLGPRQFRRKAGPDLSDRSSWTDTPEDKAKKKEGKVEPVVDLKREAELKLIHNRNMEQEKMAKAHKKEKDSLLEIHRKKLKKEKKNESGPSERRPFSREVDLQVNRFDEAQKKAVLKKAQLLDNRFSSGESKFL